MAISGDPLSPRATAATGDLCLSAEVDDAPRRRNELLRYLGLLALVCVAYIVGARVGVALAFSTKQVSAVWPPLGIALAALLLLGNRVVPGIFLGALLINALRNEPLLVACCIASGNTLAGLLAAQVLRALRFNGALAQGRDVVILLAIAVGSPVISATIGTTSLVAGSIVASSAYSSVWCTWWTGDGLGILIAAPLLLTWVEGSRAGARSIPAIAEYCAFLAVTALVSLAVFAFPKGASPFIYPRAYAAFPVLAWAGLRLGPRATAQGYAIVSIVAFWGSSHGLGPFGREPPELYLILLDAYLATLGCTALLIAAVSGERRGARLAARESEGLLKAVIGHTPAVIYVKDLQGRYLMVNRGYEDRWGMSESIVRGKTDFDVFPPDEAARFRAMDERVVRSGGALTEEEVAQRHDGLHTYVSVKFPLHNDAGETFAIVGISTDITELNQAQARLRQAYEELEARIQQRTAELAGAVAELGQRNREKETLLREIHHRVKNNLQVVCSLLSLQAQGRDAPGLLAFAADCSARVRSMALVHEHLYQSKNLNSVPLAKYVAALVQETAYAHRTPGKVRCEVEIPDEIVLPIDQAIPCGLIVNELVTNALKHAFPNGRSGVVMVCVSPAPEGRLRLLVADDGVGIAESACVSEGSNFGLTLVSMLVEQLQGTREIERKEGTAVVVRFTPRRENHQDRD